MSRRRPAVSALGALVLVLAGCIVNQSPGATEPSSPGASSALPSPSPSATAVVTAAASASTAPTVIPAPSLALDPPEVTDPRVVAVTVRSTPEIPADGSGRVVVTVESRTDSRIDELVLRWPTALSESVLLQPFAPSEDRVRDGGPPLVQPWTKWVIGPGEEGEPAGTTSVGWGPLLAGATLEIPLVATRIASGPTAFDLQVLSRNDLLTGPNGEGVEVRVELP